MIDLDSDLAFDPLSPEFDEDPSRIYRELRERDPVHWWPPGRSWVVTRYEDAVSILGDSSRFSGDYRKWREYVPPPPDEAATPMAMIHEHGLFGLQDPDHRRVRGLVNQAFTPGSTAAIRGAVEVIVDQALAPFRAGDLIDIVRDFAEFIPLRVIAALLGIDGERAIGFREWGHLMYQSTHPQLSDADRLRINVRLPEGCELLLRIFEEHGPAGRGLLGRLLGAEERGDRLSKDELLSLVGGLITAGAETTVHLIAFGVLTLLRHPDQLQLLRDDPGLIGNAVEEVLRYADFGKGTYRYATQDVAIRGKTIRRGDMVRVMIAAAQRDDRVFPDPDLFDIRRNLSQSIAFGRGPHTCLGSSVARLEGRIALGALVGRFPQMELAGGPRFVPNSRLRNLSSLPVRLG